MKSGQIAASVAFRHNLNINALLQAGYWKHANVFVKHYLRDYSTSADGLSSLQCVAAQRVIVRPRSSNQLRRVCMKCEERATVITRVNDPFCRDCFLAYAVHKFRAVIGKSKLIRDREKVLLAFSGGSASSALLHLVQEGLSEMARKKLRFIPGIVFIDESAVVCEDPEMRLSICAQIKERMLSTGYETYFSAIHLAMNINDSSKHGGDGSSSPATFMRLTNGSDDTSTLTSGQDQQRFLEILNGLKTLTAKQDFLRTLKKRLLMDIAEKTGYTKIMKADCGTRIAVRVLSNLSEGRGAHVAMEAGFADTRNADVAIVRPLKDFTAKEVSLYNHLNNIESIFTPSLTTKASSQASIEHLTENFITGLQAEFPSTVSNIVRTGEKLESSGSSLMENHCVLCKGLLDTRGGSASALSAVNYSMSISSRGSASLPVKTKDECCGEGSCKSNDGLKSDELFDALCYACRIIARNMADIWDLPAEVMREASQRSRRLKMKTEIQDFLLPEDS